MYSVSPEITLIDSGKKNHSASHCKTLSKENWHFYNMLSGSKSTTEEMYERGRSLKVLKIPSLLIRFCRLDRGSLLHCVLMQKGAGLGFSNETAWLWLGKDCRCCEKTRSCEWHKRLNRWCYLLVSWVKVLCLLAPTLAWCKWVYFGAPNTEMGPFHTAY